MSESVIIVGGGIIGLTSAYHLERAGFAVTVIDQGKIADACSRANCGYVCPSHVLPLTEPGAVQMALKSFFIPDSPFKVKPTLNPGALKWMRQFARRCNHQDMLSAGHALKAMLDASMTEYRSMISEASLDPEWKDSGLLYAFESESAFEAFGEGDAMLQKEFGVAARRMEGAEVHGFDAALREDLAGAYLYEGDAAVRPDKLNASLRTVLEARGVTFIEDCALQEVAKESDNVTALKTTQGEMVADRYLLAAGAWSAKWAKAFSCSIPILPGKGYSVTMPRPEHSPHTSVLFPESRVGVTPMEGRVRFGSMMEFSGYDTSMNPKRLALLHRGANRFLVKPIEEPVEDTWYGWRPMTYDSLPIIGQVPALKNVMLATGHNMLGLSLGASTGKLVAELMSGSSPHIDPEPYSVKRFL